MEGYVVSGKYMNIWNPALVREKLARKSKEMKLRMPQMQSLLAQERFLARLMTLPEGSHYIWKGGSLVLRLYQGLEIPRFTVDVDLLVKGLSVDKTAEVFSKAFSVDIEDGFVFKSVNSTPIERETPYGGDRFEVQWTMFGKNQSEPLKVDVCAGDFVIEDKIRTGDAFIYPGLDTDLSIAVYPPEFIFAEKLETVFRFATGNTRLKDFIDLFGLIEMGPNKKSLQIAIDGVFKNRGQKKDFVELRRILLSKEFLEILDQALIRNFSNLQFSSIRQITDKILKFCEPLLSAD